MTIDILEKLVRLTNPLVRWLLTTPLHGIVSRDIVLLIHRGRKSGREYPTPVTFIEGDGELTIATGSRWWRNLRAHPEIDLVLRGQRRRGNATVVSEDRGAIAEGIGRLLSQVPRDAMFYQVQLAPDGTPKPEDVARAAERTVLIRVRLSDDALEPSAA